jgi:hypothetical protein
MKVYNYTDNRIYCGVSDAQPSPAEPGKFLIPRNATLIQPPVHESGQIAIWNDTSWEIRNISEFIKPPVVGENQYTHWNGTAWEVHNQPHTEQKNESVSWETIKNERDILLYQCDWTDLPNTPVKNKEAWLNYRQALRDITVTYSSPEAVVWPTKPS